MQDGKRQTAAVRAIQLIAVQKTLTIRTIKILRTKTRIQAALSPAIRQVVLQIKIQGIIQKRKRKEDLKMQEKEQSRSSRLAIRRHSFFLLFLGCAAFLLAAASVAEGKSLSWKDR